MNQLKQSSKDRFKVFDNIEERLMNMAESAFVIDVGLGGILTFIGFFMMLDDMSSLCFYIGLSLMASCVTTFPLFGLGVLIKSQKDIYSILVDSNPNGISPTNISLKVSQDVNLPEL